MSRHPKDDPPGNSPGREANAAQPLGELHGQASDAQVRKTGKKERRSAGPDGPDARAVGDLFKTGAG